MRTSFLLSLLAHRHWITVSFRGRNLRLCSRCLGLFFGFLTLLGFASSLDHMFVLSLPISNQMGVVLLLTAPMVVDWTTQSWQLRESTNRLRLITGFSEGVGISLLTITAMPLAHKLLIILLVAGFTASLGMMGRRRQHKI